MEIPKYSDWVKKVSEKPEIEVNTESFKALFNKRDERTPNKQMHNFLKAYAFAVNKTIKEDRFPNLDEIENAFVDVGAQLQGQIVYNLKLRFKQNAHFFDEIDFGTKGVYLLPKASRFKDRSGKYSNLIFDFENGRVTLPELNPTSEKIVDEPKLGNEGTGKQNQESKIESEKPSRIKSVLILSLIALILITLAFLIFAPPDESALKGKNVMYSIYGSKDDGGDFLMFELFNPDGVSINSTVVLPPSRIIVEIGTVSINQFNNTVIELNTDKGAKFKMYVPGIESVPLVITHNYRGNQIPTVSGINNYHQTITSERFRWNFEIKNSTSIKIRIDQ